MTIIIGLNAYHGDSAACLVRDGQIIAAAEEERFRRIKHWAGFPSEAIRYCLHEAGAKLSDVDHIAVNSNPRAQILRRIGYAVSQRPEPRLLLERLQNHQKRLSVERELKTSFRGESFSGQINRVEHHLSHLASAFLVSPFEEAIAVSVDGFGDFSSAAWGLGKGTSISVDGRVWFPHSLGVFYQALTQFLGFPNYGDEYKVMGLAPYGKPKHLDAMRRIVRFKDDGSYALDLSYFRHHRESISYVWSDGCPTFGTLYSPALEDLLGPARNMNGEITERHRDIANSVQTMYEEAFFHLLGHLHAHYSRDTLALAGGCAMNSVANGKIKRRLPRIRRVYVQSAAGDAGGAIGAALIIWNQIARPNETQNSSAPALRGDRIQHRIVMDHAYLGPHAASDEIERLLETRKDEILSAGCQFEKISNLTELCNRTVAAITDGQVIGWFQGRMEWGPRALGNRSIVCDPRRADMKDILNLKIKRRESFRPFAPSIQNEHVSEWFEEDDDVPFMMKVFQIRESKRAQIPAVTHVDGSGRLQTVYRETNFRFWSLIETFRERTGVPLVLNTSFNENEPVVCRPGEALECFLRTHMDVLVLGDWFVQRNPIRIDL